MNNAHELRDGYWSELWEETAQRDTRTCGSAAVGGGGGMGGAGGGGGGGGTGMAGPQTPAETHSYDAVTDTVELVLPADSGAASSTYAAVKKQDGAPSREIGYTMTAPPQSHPPTPSFPNCTLVEEQWPLLCGGE